MGLFSYCVADAAQQQHLTTAHQKLPSKQLFAFLNQRLKVRRYMPMARSYEREMDSLILRTPCTFSGADTALPCAGQGYAGSNDRGFGRASLPKGSDVIALPSKGLHSFKT